MPVSRRAIVAGVAWTAPAIMLASAVPAYAASPGLYLRDGLFVTVTDMHYAQGNVTSFVGLDNVPASSSTTGDFNWPNPATGTQTANGEGTYTPGGVAGTPVKYGGTGLWLSAPTDAAGNFVAGGVTTVAAGLTMLLTITATFPTGTTPYAPDLGGQAWTVGTTYNRTTLANTSANTNLEMQSEPAYSLTPQTSTVSGNTWVGTVRIQTTAVWTIDGPTTPYSQLLLSPIAYTGVPPVTGFRATLEVTAGTASMTSTAHPTAVTQSLVGLTQTSYVS